MVHTDSGQLGTYKMPIERSNWNWERLKVIIQLMIVHNRKADCEMGDILQWPDHEIWD